MSNRDALSVRRRFPIALAINMGFLLGLLEALEMMPPASTRLLGAIGAALAFLAGALSPLRAAGRREDRALLAAWRALLCALEFALVYGFMRELLKAGDIALAMFLLILAGAVALLLNGTRVVRLVGEHLVHDRTPGRTGPAAR